MPSPGHTLWLCGLSGSGKSTLAGRLAAALRAEGRGVLELDGDRARAGLCRGLGFTDADRSENLRRAAEVARLGVESGLVVVASFITPLAAQRTLARGIVGAGHFSLVHVAAPLEICRQRDVKGLYARGTPQLTGVAQPFEIPADADLVLDTATASVEATAARLLDFARPRLSPA